MLLAAVIRSLTSQSLSGQGIVPTPDRTHLQRGARGSSHCQRGVKAKHSGMLCNNGTVRNHRSACIFVLRNPTAFLWSCVGFKHITKKKSGMSNFLISTYVLYDRRNPVGGERWRTRGRCVCHDAMYGRARTTKDSLADKVKVGWLHLACRVSCVDWNLPGRKVSTIYYL